MPDGDGYLPHRDQRRPLGKLTEGVQAFYASIPTQQELDATGFTREDYEGDDCEIWPENWPAFQLFGVMETQWNIGFNGKTGLNYLVLFAAMDRLELSKPDYDAMFADIRHMELAALNHLNSGS